MPCLILSLAPFPMPFLTYNHPLMLQLFPKPRSISLPLLLMCSDFPHLKIARLASSTLWVPLHLQHQPDAWLSLLIHWTSIHSHPPELPSPFDEITNTFNFLYTYQSQLTVCITTSLSIKGSQSRLSLQNGNKVPKAVKDIVGFILIMVKHNPQD